MALSCRQAFLPILSSQSLVDIVLHQEQQHKQQEEKEKEEKDCFGGGGHCRNFG